eukprot:6492306-Amphidinium_carterae.3
MVVAHDASQPVRVQRLSDSASHTLETAGRAHSYVISTAARVHVPRPLRACTDRPEGTVDVVAP